MIEFSSPHPIEECVRRLRNLDRGMPPLPSIDVTVRYVNSERFGFNLKRWAFFNLVVEISGELTHQSAEGTKVVANGAISLYLRLAILAYTLLVFVVMFLSINNDEYSLAIHLVFFFFSIFTWLLLKYWLGQTMYLLQQALR